MYIYANKIVILIILVSLSCIISCGKAEENNVSSQEVYITAEDLQVGVNEIYPEGFIVDDTSSLDDILKTEYDLYELKNFFENRCSNSIIENIGGTMYFDEVNERYPVEIIRPQGYSVYKVTQGGYYYVFWSKGVDFANGEQIYRPVAYFTAHLSSGLESEDFECLKEGKSTANDVRAIDSEVEFNFARSHGVYSYGYLNKDEVMQIKYIFSSKGYDDYDDLIVESMTVIPRESATTRFSSILDKDLP